MMNFVGMWTSFRSTLDSYISVVGHRFAALVWVAALAALIWIFGPRLVWGDVAPLASVQNRLIAIAVLIALWAVWALVSWLRSRRADARLIDEIADSPEARAEAETRAEVGELRSRLRDAMAMMRKVARRRFGYVYEFPWYLMIGAPGAGKTTLLTNSGLKFPLGDALGGEPVQGVGGTRNMNWWFTDRAILIDTAGRYTTQDSGHERDKAGFAGFLKMLRQRRRMQPVNGVILTLSLTDLLNQPPEGRLREIRAIRQRLAEMAATLDVRIPVYIVLTKADRLAGFQPFFERLGHEARGQVWGITFPYQETRDSTDLPAVFSREYHALTERLNDQLLDRLQQEIDLDRRGRVFRFPAQISALHDSLREIVEELSSGTGQVEPPLLRGIYLASATQEAEFRQELGGARSMNRSYFVERLFRDVILGEAGLVADDRRSTRRRRIAQGLGWGALAALVLLLGGSWLSSYVVNQRAISQINLDLGRYRDLAAAIPVREVADTDFLRVLPALDALADVPVAFATQDQNAPVPLHRIAPGLDREDTLVASFRQQYDRALGAYLLPRYMVALQNRLKQPDLPPDQAFETLKHYLSLAGLGPIDPDGLLLQSEDIFAALYPGSGREATRLQLAQHMAAMLDHGQLPVMAVDDALVAETRAHLGAHNPAQRAYDMLQSRRAARDLGEWTPAAALGPSGTRLFARASGAPLDQGIARLFTQSGYQRVVLPQITALAETAAGEGWVLGTAANAPTRATSDIAADAVALYWDDFSRQWQALLSDLTIREAADLRAASDLIATAASESRPLQRLATEIAQETSLAGSSATAALSATGLAFDPLAAPDPFAALRRGLEPQGESGETIFTPMEPLFDNIYQQISRATASDARTAEIFAADGALMSAVQDMLAQGQRLPVPADQWIVGLAARIGEASVANARSSLNQLWQSEGYGECRRATEGRYPFEPGASHDVTIADFTRIFGPDGVFQRFFDQNLSGLVDTASNPWRWSGGLGTTGEASPALAQFQRAAAIRTAFFPSGASGPQVAYSFDLISLENADVALIEIGDISSYYGQNRTRERSFTWPVTAREVAQLTLLPGSRNEGLQTTGPWAPFRLMDLGQVTPVSENQFDIRFRIGNRAADMRITGGSVNNPFSLDALQQFHCPDRL
ncbi:MAG: type VI secretion system membrane subunit TssM [Paracoccus sp. (in: a-proteobacteria)]|uniref:type VI secretion system membrane subunit TssM n=1 Tax=Paracoccus sp. TaxID=267 RepID=UPI0026DF840E|nr:type VI secretion system membrane subunit TssM [Paracoccus sp. (in: a-proteobacteria)]MDO5611864.1 type VI secretion system membrane subunit TssM [Paracoccus sp. (in: a-proteobacteria)]